MPACSSICTGCPSCFADSFAGRAKARRSTRSRARPQAWAAASVFLLIQSCLGLGISAPENRLYFSHPVLPPFLSKLQVHNLRVGEASVDLMLLRHGLDVGINVLRREGKLEITMVK